MYTAKIIFFVKNIYLFDKEKNSAKKILFILCNVKENKISMIWKCGLKAWSIIYS